MNTTRDLGVTVGTDASSSTAIPMGDMTAGVMYVAGLTASTTITLHASVDGATYRPLYDAAGTVVTMVVPATPAAVLFPAAASPVRFLKLVSAADVVAASVVISLKG